MLPFKPSSIDIRTFTAADFTNEESVHETPVEVGISGCAARKVMVHFGEPPVSAWVAAFRFPLPELLGPPRDTQ